ncbi:MAG: topoisomerase DNA-binding C4 zinc finger domain-containing protein, partial [Firmicutes bacterium]|nr:topoisomerase DNA-binding C4 zinc finger domain-containing protein [Bacillota bacterium]
IPNSSLLIPNSPPPTGIKCDKCGKEMVLRNGKLGPFYGCSGYPKCKNLKNLEPSADIPPGNCPECQKPLKKITMRASSFYGCTGYPDCRFTSAAPVLAEKCPDCGSFTVQKTLADGNFKVCGSKACKYKCKA